LRREFIHSALFSAPNQNGFGTRVYLLLGLRVARQEARVMTDTFKPAGAAFAAVVAGIAAPAGLVDAADAAMAQRAAQAEALASAAATFAPAEPFGAADEAPAQRDLFDL
jgi:hypothetical protein